MKWKRLQRAVFISFLAVVIGSLAIYPALNDQIDLQSIRETISGFGIWAPVVFVVLYMVGTIFIPSTPFMIIAGILFGFRYGLLYTIIGGFLSSFAVFWISRKLGKDQADSLLEHKYLKYINIYNQRLEKGAIFDLIILRITPIMPFNILSIIMGLSRIKTRDYVIGTVLGLIPSNIITVYLGSFLPRIF